MNIFYAPPEHHQAGQIELRDQEARHASKVLRYREGDDIDIVDGQGGRYKCKVIQIADSFLKAEVKSSEKHEAPKPELILGLGLIKKRDRLEFAVEKAVELGVSQICLFRSRHTVKGNVRMNRLNMTVLSAMKQSLRAWLPQVQLLNSLETVIDNYNGVQSLLAHVCADDEAANISDFAGKDKLLLLVGPEGGFSQDEVEYAMSHGAETISLGKNRLRAETAAITFMSQFI